MRGQWHRVVRVGVLGVFAPATTLWAQGVPPSAANAAEDFCAGKIRSEQMVSAALARAKERTDLNAFVTLDEAGALAAAKRADASKGHARCKPLSGVPIVVKDNIEVARLPTTGGTPGLKGYVPTADAPVVKKLRDAGAIVLGKTNMHELAFGISGYNPAYNTSSSVGVRNASDVCATPAAHRRAPVPRWARAS
jgi:mandelamide amidase